MPGWLAVPRDWLASLGEIARIGGSEMGIVYLCPTRLLGAWMTLPFMLAAIGVGYFASYLAVAEQIGEVSAGGYFLIFWMGANPKAPIGG